MRRIAFMMVGLMAVALAAPAQAVAPTGDQSYLLRVLAPSDVPVALGTPLPDATEHDRSRIARAVLPICSRQDGAQSAPVEVGGAGGFEGLVVTTKDDQTYREVDEVVALYPAAAAAARAWRQVRAKARACNRTVVVTDVDPADPNAGQQADAYRSGSVAGADAVWVSQSSAWRSADQEIDGTMTTSYTVLRRSGNAVVATWTYINGHPTTTPAERRATVALSGTLAERW
jgi:hypothetical protein